MSKNVAIFVDVANLYYAARGQDVDVDYVALLKHATKGRDLIRAYAYSGLDPENDNQKKFIDFLNKNGYKVLTKDIRKFTDGRVKANLDIELVVDLFKLAQRMDIAVIVSGDGDFAPAIRALQDQGVRCEVISFRPNTSSDLIAVADEFIDAMKLSIGRGKDSAPAPTAEMPAKEVVPEFGFREAAPHIAAAAKAALRGGDGSPARTRGGRSESTSRRGTGRGVAAATAAAASGPAIPIETDADGAVAGADAGTHRRRRRGGRGRGRGRQTGDVVTGTEAPEAGTAEWQEFGSIDDLNALDTDKTYEFEEADAATLAELGISQPATEPAAPATKPRRSRTKASAEPVAEPATEPAAPAAKPRRSRTKANAEPVAEPAAEPAAPAAKPRRSRTKATAEPVVEPPTTGEDGEGIWQRFTSGRATTRSKKPATDS